MTGETPRGIGEIVPENPAVVKLENNEILLYDRDNEDAWLQGPSVDPRGYI